MRLNTPQRMDQHLWRMLGKAVLGTDQKRPQRDKRFRNTFKRLMALRDENLSVTQKDVGA